MRNRWKTRQAQLIFSVDFDQLCLESEKAELKILTLEGASAARS